MSICHILVVLLTFGAVVSSQQIIYPYHPQCQNPSPSNYEMDYPCTWINEIGRWDMTSSYFLCYNVPSTYNVSYHVESIGSNQYGYSVSLWTFDSYSSDISISYQMNYINYYLTQWLEKRPYDVQYPPLNGQIAYDYSAGNHDFNQQFQSSSRTFPGVVMMFINREQYASQFPCYYLNVSLSIL